MRLSDSQTLFCASLFDREEQAQVLPLFKGDAQVAEQRLSLYRGNLTASWNKTLSSAYPVMKALVGDEFFEGLTRAYGKAYPSQDGDLNRFGDRFTEFLASFRHTADYPYFPDMARLEWALHRTYYADDAPALDPAQWAKMTPEQLDGARLRFHPACTLFDSTWAVVDIWQAHQPEASCGLPLELAYANHAVIARPEWKVEVLAVDAAGFAALSILHERKTLGEAVDAAVEIDPVFDFGNELQQWLRYRLFVAIDIVEPEQKGREE